MVDTERYEITVQAVHGDAEFRLIYCTGNDFDDLCSDIGVRLQPKIYYMDRRKIRLFYSLNQKLVEVENYDQLVKTHPCTLPTPKLYYTVDHDYLRPLTKKKAETERRLHLNPKLLT